ncbi:putative F-box protein At3g25750 [Amaranthus tricolor]|uniref:putative F-box protein At3g25750 n=1 Tax=Amaranthus tricolor TaxID=29722 RepID=UPI002590C145|nr:putative F-box protein At3g25750 [Amaranthus tricolor]
MQHQIVNWSDLCSEILSEIANHLETRSDVYNFRQVCKNWRFSLSNIPQKLPYLSSLFPRRYLAVDSDFFALLSRETHHHLVADAVYLLRPRNHQIYSKPWLITVEEFNRGKLSIRLPLSKIRAKGILPANENSPISLNLFDFDVNLIARGYSLRAPESDETYSANGGLRFKNKLILFPIPVGFQPLTIDDYIGLLWFEDGLIAWLTLSGSLDWGFLGYKRTSKFDDIVNFKSKVYVVDHRGRIYVLNHDPEPTNGKNYKQNLRLDCIVSDSFSSGCDTDRRNRLVDDSRDLYVVKRIVYCGDKIHFKVFKLDEENGKLEEIGSLEDDRILFVGVEWCFFGSKADFPGCRGNCIFFTSDSFPVYGRGRLSKGVSDESYFRGTTKGLEFAVFHFADGNARPITDFSGHSEFLWPPPACFCSASTLF